MEGSYLYRNNNSKEQNGNNRTLELDKAWFKVMPYRLFTIWSDKSNQFISLSLFLIFIISVIILAFSESCFWRLNEIMYIMFLNGAWCIVVGVQCSFCFFFLHWHLSNDELQSNNKRIPVLKNQVYSKIENIFYYLQICGLQWCFSLKSIS